MSNQIKVIDLFAGPGGLGEGFSALKVKGRHPFRIALSIEKEESAHRTLLLRALFRQFPGESVPDAYYAFLRGELGIDPEDQLYQLAELKTAVKDAADEAQRRTLGENHREIYKIIRGALGKDECVLIGGPPCQAYSLAGRSKNFGDARKGGKIYTAESDHRNFLYREYLRIIAKFQPMAFLMENVKGILSASAHGKLIFGSILNDLRDPCRSVKLQPESGRTKHRYHIMSLSPDSRTCDLFSNSSASPLDPHDFVIRAEQHGIPQARHRVILLGVREDLYTNWDDSFKLQGSTKRTSVAQVISDLPPLRSKLSKGNDSVREWRRSAAKLNGLLPDIVMSGHASTDVIEALRETIDALDQTPENTGSDKGQRKRKSGLACPIALREWYRDRRLAEFVVNHESRGHIAEDIRRYLYYSVFSRICGDSPTSGNLPQVLWPHHKNFGSGKFADRFRVQRKDYPATTITSHISKDGHYYIHYDPTQCRSFTVREAARIQTFPDNYCFVGNRTQQYVQVGNAVPPFLALQIAESVLRLVWGNTPTLSTLNRERPENKSNPVWSTRN